MTALRRPLAAALLLLVLGACGSATEELRATTTPPTATVATTTTPTTTAATAAETSTTEPSSSTGDDEASAETTAPTDSAADEPAAPEALAGHYVPVVEATFPHDEQAWTQGLEWVDGRLLESTGRNGFSSLRLVDATSGEPEVLVPIAEDLYAEGATVVDDRVVQITYRDEVVLVTDLDALTDDDPATGAPERVTGAYQGEGWGLCYDGADLVMTDGSAQLFFRDPDTFELRRSVPVTLNGQAVADLNELECVGDQVLANVWQTPTIVAIDAETGVVEATVDATELVPPGYEDVSDAVLNGIAYNPDTATFWLTGKLWPVLYEVTFVPADAGS